MFRATVSIDLKEKRSARVVFFVSEGRELEHVVVKKGMAPAQGIQLPLSNQPRGDSILGMDCYFYEHNSVGDLCAVRVGVDSVYLNACPPSTRCTLRHPTTNYVAGTVTLTAIQCPEVSNHEARYGPAQQAGVNKAMDDYVVAAYQPFRKGTLQPSVEAVRRIHAPMYRTRTTMLPGVSFWMAGRITFKEAYLNHVASLVARRYDISLEHVSSLAPHRLASFYVDVCTVYPSSCSYISDFFTDEGQKIHVESFDDLLFRNAGDCEDVSKAICSIADHIRFSTWTGPVAQCLQTMSTWYTPFSILGAVERPSWDHVGTSSVAAHMYVNFVPNHMVKRWTGLDLPVADTPLRLLVAEGTGHVACDFVQNEVDPRPSPVRVPVGISRYSKPHRDNAFYQLHVHAYTNTLFRMGHNVGHLTFLDDKGRFGVSSRKMFDDEVAVHVHAGFTADQRDDIEAVLRLEAPTPALRVPTPLQIGGLYDDLQPVSTKTDNATDYYVLPEHLSLVKKALTRMKPKGVVCVAEQTRPGCVQHRIRVYH